MPQSCTTEVNWAEMVASGVSWDREPQLHWLRACQVQLSPAGNGMVHEAENVQHKAHPEEAEKESVTSLGGRHLPVKQIKPRGDLDGGERNLSMTQGHQSHRIEKSKARAQT